jgi:hypothetical protein
MNLLHRLLCLGCLAAVLAPFGQAQAPSESNGSTANSSAGGWLGREEPNVVAWRVHDAMIAHDGAAIPELLSLASQWQPLSPQTYSNGSQWPRLSAQQEEERDAMTAVLDALIQLNAEVPAATLRNLALDFENAVAVILARMPIEESGPLSLEFYRSPIRANSTLQYVSAALLALHPRSGFAGKLLGDIKVRAAVVVILPGGPSEGSGSIGDCFGSSKPRHDGWPESGQYKLSGEMSNGATLLVAGTEPIYVNRVESSRYLGDTCDGSGGFYLGAAQRRDFIAEMLGVASEAIPWKTDPRRDIEFESFQQFHGELLTFIDEQQQMYRATAEELEARGLLDPTEVSQSLPQMDVDLTDARWVDSDGERPKDAEPISRDAIKLPARVVWAE